MTRASDSTADGMVCVCITRRTADGEGTIQGIAVPLAMVGYLPIQRAHISTLDSRVPRHSRAVLIPIRIPTVGREAGPHHPVSGLGQFGLAKDQMKLTTLHSGICRRKCRYG